jgi:hypothetical protein
VSSNPLAEARERRCPMEKFMGWAIVLTSFGFVGAVVLGLL